ncbi:MAG TPA: bacteriohopanetetrol glucosamine biosynthesis glycosyltransferase HpnI [Candidatus Sulfotelmatobacter sp.]|nr:bacteriohopanetetrol glucosamine biosynthesis glycosyltransferase HpnI [Candidatus Sulfotelmatobacter sp.]
MIDSTFKIFQVVAILIPCLGCLSSSIYYLICLWSAAVFLRGQRAAGKACPEPAEGSACPTQPLPPVSIFKPLKGTDPDIYESFRSHCLQDYPEYEIVFGVSDPDDPAVASVRLLQQEFPGHAIRLVVVPKILGANVKVSNLAQMLGEARYEYLLVNDSDIRVEGDYLRRVMAPLADDHVGMVTCLYRGVPAPTLGSRLESLGISTDFCAGVLAARQLEGGIRFGLGSTLAFRRADLERIGGFESFVDFLADDYELGRRIAGLGLRIVLSDVVVETHLPAYDLRGFLAHQLRWARGVRDARRGGYIGLVSTYGLMWGLLAVIAARGAAWSWGVFGVTVLLRLSVALAVGKSVLQDAHLLKNLWLLPVRDLVAVAVWIASFAGHTVTWRGDRFELKNGRLIRIAP